MTSAHALCRIIDSLHLQNVAAMKLDVIVLTQYWITIDFTECSLSKDCVSMCVFLLGL